MNCRAPRTLDIAFPQPRFNLLTGHAELAVAEAVSNSIPRPEKVNTILLATISHLNHKVAHLADFENLTSAGREWLLHKCANLFFKGDWFEAHCEHCQAQFDLQLSLQELPKSEATANFPLFHVNTSMGTKTFEAPNGVLEQTIVHSPSSDPRRIYAAVCGLSETANEDAKRFTEKDLTDIENALESCSPDIADSVHVNCPDCGRANDIRIDPLQFAFPYWENILGEVHQLAQRYHWSEHAILELPLHRRKAYISLIRRQSSNRALA